MKARLQQLGARIDALSQRERVMVFAAMLALLVFLGRIALLGPLQHRQDLLKSQIQQQRTSLLETDAAIARKLAEAEVDPDLALRMRLEAVRSSAEQLDRSLRSMQNGLVPPERIGPLVESILRANGRLALVSMQTLPVSALNGADKDAGKSPDPGKPTGARQPDLLYRHGVELTLRGRYLDMVDYMAALEALPNQLFWGKAQLEVEQYPNVRLTLTLYTLSLDPKWMKL